MLNFITTCIISLSDFLIALNCLKERTSYILVYMWATGSHVLLVCVLLFPSSPASVAWRVRCAPTWPPPVTPQLLLPVAYPATVCTGANTSYKTAFLVKIPKRREQVWYFSKYWLRPHSGRTSSTLGSHAFSRPFLFNSFSSWLRFAKMIAQQVY